MNAKTERRIALFFCLCNIPLGLAGAYGLLLMAMMAAAEIQQRRPAEATGYALLFWAAGLCGYALWWGYFRVCRGHTPPRGHRRFWTLSAAYNGIGILAGLAVAGLGGPFLLFLWFPLAVILSWKARAASPKTGDPG